MPKPAQTLENHRKPPDPPIWPPTLLELDREGAASRGPYLVTVRTRSGRVVARRFEALSTAEAYRAEIIAVPGVVETALAHDT